MLLALTGWGSSEPLSYELHDDLICFPLEAADQVATALEYYHVYWGTNQLYSNQMTLMSNRVDYYSNRAYALRPGRREKAAWIGIGAGATLLLRLLLRALL